MKTIIAGSRSIKNYLYTKQAVEESGFIITEVICGCADGPDSYGRTWALLNNVPYALYPVLKSEWDLYGKSAGNRRNTEMAVIAEQLILIWDGVSTGSADMLKKAKDKGIPVYIKIVNLDKAILPGNALWESIPEVNIYIPHWTDNYYGNN